MDAHQSPVELSGAVCGDEVASLCREGAACLLLLDHVEVRLGQNPVEVICPAGKVICFSLYCGESLDLVAGPNNGVAKCTLWVDTYLDGDASRKVG